MTRAIIAATLVASLAGGAMADISYVELGQKDWPRSIFPFSGKQSPDVADATGISERARVIDAKSLEQVISVAIDYSSPDAAEPDVLAIDFSGKRQFTDAPRVKLAFQGPAASRQAAIESTTLEVSRDGRAVKVNLKGSCSVGPQQSSCLLFTAAIAQDTIQVAGKEMPVRIQDTSHDLEFKGLMRRTPRSYIPADTIMLPDTDGKFTRLYHYGQPVWIEDAFYRITTSDDGTKITAQAIDAEPALVPTQADELVLFVASGNTSMMFDGGPPGVPLPRALTCCRASASAIATALR